MFNVRAGCHSCGPVTVRADALTVQRGSGAREPSFEFVCPSCARRVRCVTDGRTARLLVDAGAPARPPADDGDVAGASPEVADEQIAALCRDLAAPGALERYVSHTDPGPPPA